MDKITITLDYPLVDDNFEVIEEKANDFIEKTNDESKKFIVNIKVRDMTMVPTAMFFSFRDRINIDFIVELGKFTGSDFIYSFLKSGHIKGVIYE